MSTIYDHMLAAYDLTTAQRHRSAIYEVSQQIILSGLSRGGFFDVAAFYGGTCLRMFHGLQRFSEDMDFTLLAPDDTFDLTRYFQPLIDEFALLGRKVEIRKKEKTALSSIHSAFLKDTTDVYDLTFRTDPSIKIKLEVDVRPPLDFPTEYRLLMQPRSFMTRCLTLPDLFAWKMHALVFRAWKTRVKGRDWYDMEWYVRRRIPLDFRHLRARIRQSSGIDMTYEQFRQALDRRIRTADIAPRSSATPSPSSATPPSSTSGPPTTSCKSPTRSSSPRREREETRAKSEE